MYRTAQQIQWDNYSILDYAKKEARESGTEEGRQAGLKEGRKEGLKYGALAEKKEIAKNLKVEGIDIEIIAGATGLSMEEVISL